MNYVSTRDKNVKIESARAIAQGISRDSGLFVPETLPELDSSRLERLAKGDYIARACDILGDFLTDFTTEEISQCVTAAYGSGKFADEKVAPLSKISDSAYMLELWHGPTCAFKDMALQVLPHLLTLSLKKAMGGKNAAILVATSGDTGKAALEGFKDVAGTKILTFYPDGGVSRIQYLQMASQEGSNVSVCGVRGNFDDTQTAVKAIFADAALRERLEAENYIFSSANSINWGRLVPQIVYYISAYLDLVSEGEIRLGDMVNICVPTGNFGNILAAYYAKMMGLPVDRLICASNVNNVLTDFINTGVYDRRREFVLTSSPSMDILISSNLERLLFSLYGHDSEAVGSLMQSLSEKGFYNIGLVSRAKLQAKFYGDYCGEAKTAATIRKTFEEKGYLCDTHTAVALAVYERYAEVTGDNTKTIIASTANPYKFAGSILTALTGKASGDDEFEQINKLHELTGAPVPAQILGLSSKSARFTDVCDIYEMPRTAEKLLGF